MEEFSVYILGCGSAKPTLRHQPSCQVVNVHDKLYMIDCGESAQMGFAKTGLNIQRLGHIFITHNHGDHVFGLPGLLSTLALLGRTADLHIYAPRTLQEYLDTVLRIYCDGMDYQVLFHAVDPCLNQVVFQDRSVRVESIPLSHRLPCCGYRFVEATGLPHIRREMIDAFHIPISQINNIKMGASWTTPDGTFIPHEKLTTPARQSRSYAYCSDTVFKPDIVPYVSHSDLLYHEATYSGEMELRATQTLHTTAPQAARIALQAEVGKLCIGHFSARIRNEQALLDEAKAIFPNCVLANEGLVIKL